MTFPEKIGSKNIYGSIHEDLSAIPVGKRVFTNGCFDILHAGHLKCLTAAKGLGDILIVGLNSNASVRQLKGNDRPINTWEDRAYLLSGLSCVDVIIGFNEATPIDLIKHLRPDIICKGGDYAMEDMIGKDFVEGYGGKVVILPFHKGFSTTHTIKMMKQSS